jgi:hypothetical protein
VGHWIDNPELGQIAFQYGTRPLLTEESRSRRVEGPLRTLDDGDVPAAPVLADRVLQLGGAQSRSCAARRPQRAADPYSRVRAGEHTVQLDVGVKGKNFWVAPKDRDRARAWFGRVSPRRSRPPTTRGVRHAGRARGDPRGPGRVHGLPVALRLLVVEGPRRLLDGRLADPRSFCIQKTLQDIAHGGTPSRT